MAALIQDTAFGHLVRLLSGKRYLKFMDEEDSSIFVADLKRRRRIAEVEARSCDTSLYSKEQILDAEKHKDNLSCASSSQISSRRDARYPRSREVIDWMENDPENPRNWPLWKRCWVTFIICFFSMSVYMSSAIYTAGTFSVMQTFGVSQVAATLGLCLFVAGYGLGPMLWSSMSEVPTIGRNPVYIGTLAAFVALQIPTIKASNFGMLLAFRFITGFVGSPIIATGGASIADIWRPAKQAYGISLWGVAAIMGPTMGPLVGGFAVQYGPLNGQITAAWQWPLWILTWMCAICLILLFFFLPETGAANILTRRTQRLRKRLGVDKSRLICRPEIEMDEMTGKQIVMMVLVRPFTLNFQEPMVLLLNLYIALIYGVLYIWFESFPIVFTEIHGFTISQTGLAYLGITVGMIIICPIYFIYLYYCLEPQFDKDGNIRPEARLVSCFVGCWCIPICLFWFGWTSRADIHWIWPIIGSSFFSFGCFLIFNGILNYLPDAYPDYVPSVMAGSDLMRSAFGAGFPLFARAMFKNLGVDWASSCLGFISITFIPIPFVLYKYGARLRSYHSKYARKDF